MLLNRETPRGGSAERVVAVVFDWAGTTVDFGSLAPVRTLQRVFEEAAVSITEAEARREMGIAKRDHIAAILSLPRVSESWRQKHGARPADKEIAALYERFVPLQFECLREYSKMIPGVVDVVRELRGRGVKIGSTTGYTRPMLEVLLQDAAAAGYEPDCAFCPEDVGAGRPKPFMMYAALQAMKVFPASAVVKVGDTISDIQEALNAGAWAVGVALTGNAIGLSKSDFDALPMEERERNAQQARKELARGGAHYVIDTLADLPSVVIGIETHLAGRSTD